jgi:type I restriction enzyme S subunit
MKSEKLQIKNENLPNGWRKVKLGEIVENFDSKRIPLSSIQRAKMKGEYPYYGAAGIIDYINDYIFDGLYLLIAEDGTLTSNGDKPMLQLVKGKFWVNNHAHVIKGKDDLETMFLFYALSTISIIPYITGAVQPKLTQENLNNIEILYPEDKKIREKIVLILSAFDDKIEVNNKIIKTLEEMAQEVFKEKFNNSEKLIVNSEKLKLEKWKIKDVEDVFVFEKGIEPGSKYYSETKKEGYVPFYRVRDLDKQDGVDVYIPEKIANGKICKESDVLLSLDATVGRVKIGCNGAFSSGIRKVYSKDGFIKNSFIYFWLKTPYVQNTILEHASGTTILHAGQAIKYLKIPFNKEIIKEIQLKAEPMFEKILQILEENQKLVALRDLLLPKLMSGEILVNSE